MLKCNIFEDVVGSNLDNTRKDKFDIINYILTQYNLDQAQTIMIGDTKFDMIGAQKNNIKAVGVTYGYGTLQELEQENTAFIIDNIELLPNLIEEIKKQQWISL